jgi:hypothetical protein
MSLVLYLSFSSDCVCETERGREREGLHVSDTEIRSSDEIRAGRDKIEEEGMKTIILNLRTEETRPSTRKSHSLKIWTLSRLSGTILGCLAHPCGLPLQWANLCRKTLSFKN